MVLTQFLRYSLTRYRDLTKHGIVGKADEAGVERGWRVGNELG